MAGSPLSAPEAIIFLGAVVGVGVIIFASAASAKTTVIENEQSTGYAKTVRKISANGIYKLKGREGFSPVRYWDHKGYSIGYGHLIRAGENLNYLTEQEAHNLLLIDLVRFENAVNDAVSVYLNQNQFDALVSFAYNVGVSAFKNSTLVKRLNAGDFDDVSYQLRRWNKASGQVNSGLVNRREQEVSQFWA